MGGSKCFVLFLATMVLCGFAGCTHKPGTPEDPWGHAPVNGNDTRKIVLTLQTLQFEKNVPAYKIEEKLVKTYMDTHPNVTIQFDRLDVEQQKAKLKTQAAAGEVADITMVNPGAQMKPFVDAGVLAPLNDIVDGELRATFRSGVLGYYTFNDMVYALPNNLNVAGIFYNKELFGKAGVTVPTTFEQLLDTVKTLRAKGITPMAVGAKDRWPTSFLFMNILQRLNGGPGFLQDVIHGRRTFNDPVFVRSIEKLQELIQAGAFEKGAALVDSMSASQMFRSGQAAMYYIGTWEVPKIEVSPVNGKVGFMKFPTVEGLGSPNDFMIAPGTAYALSASSPHLKASKQFLKYFMLNYPKVAVEMNSAVGLSQQVEAELNPAGYSELQVETLRIFKDIRGGEMNFDNVIVPAVTQTHLDQLQNLFVQKVKAEDVAREHQSSWEASVKRK